jgi:hypothetical protein
MIVPTDQDYKDTKLIKDGAKVLVNPFKQLAEWINENYAANVINITYDTIKPNNRPRLNIIFEFTRDRNKFINKIGNYNEEYQNDIANEFNKLLKLEKQYHVERKYNLFNIFRISHFKHRRNNLLVTFQDFEHVAKAEINEAIPKTFIDELKSRYLKYNVWEISRFSEYTTIFFFTNDQLNESLNAEVRENIRRDYYSQLKHYDKYSYFHYESFNLSFDSKENFDNKYESNWYYYYK